MFRYSRVRHLNSSFLRSRPARCVNFPPFYYIFGILVGMDHMFLLFFYLLRLFSAFLLLIESFPLLLPSQLLLQQLLLQSAPESLLFVVRLLSAATASRNSCCRQTSATLITRSKRLLTAPTLFEMIEVITTGRVESAIECLSYSKLLPNRRTMMTFCFAHLHRARSSTVLR